MRINDVQYKHKNETAHIIRELYHNFSNLPRQQSFIEYDLR